MEVYVPFPKSHPQAVTGGDKKQVDKADGDTCVHPFPTQITAAYCSVVSLIYLILFLSEFFFLPAPPMTLVHLLPTHV